MIRYAALVAIFFAAIGAALVVQFLAEAVGPGAALAAAAALIVVASAVFQRRLRLHGRQRGTSALLLRRAALLPALLLIGAFAALSLVGAAAALFSGIAATGSGGIGSVSAGLSEAIVEIMLAGIVVTLVAAGLWTVGSGPSEDADRDESK